MAREIYRKVSLDRLSSPEQLDLLLNVTSSKGWVGLLALCGALLAGLLWGFLGRIDTTVPGQGVIVRLGGVYNVVPLAPGRLIEVRVKVGDIITAGQVVARIAQPNQEQKLKAAREQMSEADRAVQRQHGADAAAEAAKKEAIAKQTLAMEQEIRDTENQIAFAKQQIPIDEQLADKGLVTRQTAINDKLKVAQLEGSISKLQGQISQLQAESVSTTNQVAQASVESRNKLGDLARNIRQAENDLNWASNVVSTNGGRVVELKVYPGAIVNAGEAIISIEPGVNALEAITYVPSAKAKEIRPKMPVNISPSGVQREEYGYMLGTVASIGDFPATSEAIVRTFENDALAKDMLGAGPVTEVRVHFTPDLRTRSGFKWSSPQGPPTRLSSGSVCAVEVVTRSQPPIATVLPYLKKKLNIS
jgi:HlyD family secretion protein